MDSKVCVRCGTEFTRPKKYSDKQWEPRRYCSQPCITAHPDLTAEERFWSRVDRTAESPDACWVWTGPANGLGYGLARKNGRPFFAHRRAWELANGPIPRGMNVCHHCDNPPCCRPAHLFLGTHADNVADMIAKGRNATGEMTAPRKHPERVPRGEAHAFAKLTRDTVEQVVRLRRSGLSYRTISTQSGVDWWTVRDICKGRSWKHVTGLQRGGFLS